MLLEAASQHGDFPPDAVRLDHEDDSAASVSRSLSHNLDCTKIKTTFAIKQQSWRANVAEHVRLYFQGG